MVMNFGNFGPLIPYAAPVNNVFNSTQMWGSNPFSGPFNQMPATINYPNVLFLPFGGSPVNLQPPANLLQTPGVGPFLGSPGIFGSPFIPQSQQFGGPPPFTLNFGAAGFGGQQFGGFGGQQFGGFGGQQFGGFGGQQFGGFGGQQFGGFPGHFGGFHGQF